MDKFFSFAPLRQLVLRDAVPNAKVAGIEILDVNRGPIEPGLEFSMTKTLEWRYHRPG